MENFPSVIIPPPSTAAPGLPATGVNWIEPFSSGLPSRFTVPETASRGSSSPSLQPEPRKPIRRISTARQHQQRFRTIIDTPLLALRSHEPLQYLAFPAFARNAGFPSVQRWEGPGDPRPTSISIPSWESRSINASLERSKMRYDQIPHPKTVVPDARLRCPCLGLDFALQGD